MKLEKDEKISRNLFGTGLILGAFVLVFPPVGIMLGLPAKAASLLGDGLALFKFSEIVKPEAK